MALEGKQFSHYRLLQMIGQGGMGEVYVAEDIQVRRQVAVKMIRMEMVGWNQETGSQALRLFWREATAIAQLDHPNILPLYDYGEVTIDGLPRAYLIMPYRPEGSLVSWLKRRAQSPQVQRLTLQQVAHILLQAGRALQYAHDHHVMHLDVKPDNFLIREQPGIEGNPDLLLTDFGIARLSSTTTGQSQQVRGTPAYMAPEQCVSQPVFASDQYALAIMTYELLTGNTPFRGTPMQVMFAHMQEQPGSVRLSNPLLPPLVDSVLQKALAKPPEQRFPSVAAFTLAFQEALQGGDESTFMRVPLALPIPSSTENRYPSLPITGQPARDGSLTPAPSIPSPTGHVYSSLTITGQQARDGGSRPLTLANGHTITVQIPPGTQSGQVLTLPGSGTTTAPGMMAGNLYLKLTVDEPATERQTSETLPPSPLRRARHLSIAVMWRILLLLIFLGGGGYLSLYRVQTGQWPWSGSSGPAQTIQKLLSSTSTSTTSTSTTSASTGSGGLWQSQHSGTTQDLTSVAWSGSAFVAVGGTYNSGNGVGNAQSNGVILVSQDGHNWTPQHVNNLPYLKEVIWAHGQFAALGEVSDKTDVVYTSPDGHTWTALNLNFDANAFFSQLTDIIWAGSQFVALGFGGYTFTSPDGRTWTTRDAGDVDITNSLAWSGSQFVAVGEAGAIFTSPDATTWTAQALNSSPNLNSVVWGDSQFVAVGDAVLTSRDGINWTTRNAGGGDLINLTNVTWSGSEFVAVGWGNQILVSHDGITWTSQSSLGSTSLSGAAGSSARLIVVGDKGTILASS